MGFILFFSPISHSYGLMQEEELTVTMEGMKVSRVLLTEDEFHYVITRHNIYLLTY